MSVAVLFPVFGSGTPFGDVTVAYRVELVGNRLEWVTREGNNQVRFDSESETSLWKRIQVTVLSWLPIEGLL